MNHYEDDELKSVSREDRMSLLDMLEKAERGHERRAHKRATRFGGPAPEQRFWGEFDPMTYTERYEALPKFGKESNLGRLFAGGVGQHHKPLVDRVARELLPGMYSFDEPVLQFLRELTSDLNAALKVDIDDEGFTKTGIHTSFDRLRCPAGYMQDPMSAKPVDNKRLRDELGLNPGYTARQRAIARAVWMDVWSEAIASAVNVPKHSAGGMRRFTHDVGWKLDYAQWKMHHDNYDKFLTMMESGDAFGLANEFEIVYGMYTQKRLQLDDVTKVRMSNDWAYAISGGARGIRAPTNKSVTINGVKYEDFSALRVRVIDAGPWAVNCDLQAVASSHMKSIFDRYPSVFHVNTDDQITDVINGRYIFCSDVSEYDQSMSADAMSVVFETMREFYPEGMARSAERLFQAPYFARPLTLDGKKGQWIANPMDWSFSMNAGNRSGHAMTSLIAKVNKVIESLFIIDHVIPLGPANDVSGWKDVLLGRLPIGMINNGDDEVIWADSEALLDNFKVFRSKLDLGHYVVGPETGQGFSGRLLTRPNPTEPFYVPKGKVHTAFEKGYVPERSIGGVLRPFWPIGWMDRFNNLSETDEGREAIEVHKHCYKKHLEPRYGSLTGLLRKGQSELPALRPDLSAIDRMVLVDPDKLHYLYSDDDVSADIRALITTNIPKEYVRGFLQRYYQGNLN